MSELTAPRRVRPLRGLHWIIEGARLVAKKPITFLAFFAMVWLALIVGAQNQILLIAVQLFMPALLAGGYRICAAVHRNQTVPATMLTSGFQRGLGSFVALGGVYFLGNILALVTTILLGGQELVHAMNDPKSVTPEMADALLPRMRMAMIVALAIILPLQLALWFAPVSVALSQTPVAKALRRSLVAILRNLLPFVIYLAALLVILYLGFQVMLAVGMSNSGALYAMVAFLVPATVPSNYIAYREMLIGLDP